MSRLIVHTVDGEIMGNKTAPKWSLEQYLSDSEEPCLIIDDGQSFKFHYVDNGELVEKPEQPSQEYTFDYVTKLWVYDLTRHRNEKWAEIKTGRSAEEFGTFVWNDHTFDCDETSQRRIQGAVQLAALDPDIVMDWTLADNTVQTFNATELQQIGQALASHVNDCHVKARGLRSQIDAAQTEAELSVISW
jgi:hypothetical protein